MDREFRSVPLSLDLCTRDRLPPKHRTNKPFSRPEPHPSKEFSTRRLLQTVASLPRQGNSVCLTQTLERPQPSRRRPLRYLRGEVHRGRRGSDPDAARGLPRNAQSARAGRSSASSPTKASRVQRQPRSGPRGREAAGGGGCRRARCDGVPPRPALRPAFPRGGRQAGGGGRPNRNLARDETAGRPPTLGPERFRAIGPGAGGGSREARP